MTLYYQSNLQHRHQPCVVNLIHIYIHHQQLVCKRRHAQPLHVPRNRPAAVPAMLPADLATVSSSMHHDGVVLQKP